MHELKIDVFGRVQGVGFRQFVKKSADQWTIRGQVRNMPDGRVSIIGQGSRSNLQSFLDAVQRGPFLAKVKGISYLWRSVATVYGDFTISVDRPFIEDQTASFTHLGKHLLHVQKAVPRHIAIIPDGNRRWAASKGLERSEGHRASASYDKVTGLLEEAQQLGIRYLTFWGFSTENWDRDPREIKEVFSLIEGLLVRFKKDLVARKIRFRHFGRRDRLPGSVLRAIDALEDVTASFSDYHINLCIDYGGRDELTRAMNKLLQSGVQEVTEEALSRFLDTHGIPDPDLIIRTSGEQRTSGFMPFQSTYAEFYFTPVHFPDFGPDQLRAAVDEFARRKRNFGK